MLPEVEAGDCRPRVRRDHRFAFRAGGPYDLSQPGAVGHRLFQQRIDSLPACVLFLRVVAPQPLGRLEAVAERKALRPNRVAEPRILARAHSTPQLALDLFTQLLDPPRACRTCLAPTVFLFAEGAVSQLPSFRRHTREKREAAR